MIMAKIMAKIENICRSIGCFVRREWWMTLFYTMLLALPAWFRWRYNGTLALVETDLFPAASTAIIAATFLALVRDLLLKRRTVLRRVMASVLTSFVAFISLSDLWLLFVMHSRWSDRILTMVFSSNPSEASEFLSVYIFSTRRLLFICGFIVAVLLIYAGLRVLASYLALRIGNLSVKRSVAYTVIAAVANIYSTVYCCLYYFEVVPADDQPKNVIWQISSAMDIYLTYADKVRDIEKATVESHASLRKGYRPPARIVWVIGESDNRHHSQLYGYRMPTTPQMKREHAEGNLIVWRDVVSYMPSTFAMMEKCFSPHVVWDDATEYRHTPILPALLRKAGYHVRLHDNQVTITHNGDNFWERGSMYFLNSPVISRESFDYRNDTVCSFDLDFIRRERAMLRDAVSPAVDIFHIHGQHFKAMFRYPDDFEAFTAKDYLWRKDLNDAQREELATYDTATRYVDGVLGAIVESLRGQDAVMIYMSDHGEEVHDFRPHYGREFPSIKEQAECLLDVPFLIYTTPEFRERHPELYSKLLAGADSKMSLVYFSHFMLDLAGVETKWFHPELSPLNPAWCSPRRPVEDCIDYDLFRHGKPILRKKD